MNNKKIIIYLVALVAVILLSACSISSDIATEEYFEFNPETGAIIKYHPKGIDDNLESISNLIVPNEIDGIKVKSISPNAFNYEKELKSVVLSDNITSIDDYAFYGCKNLKEVIMGNQVIGVGDLAFYGCESLESVTFGNSVEFIGKDAFKGARALKAIDLPNQVKQVGEGAFFGLRNVEEINLGNGLESIEKYAFYGVGSYEGIELVIPESVKYIGESAFANVNITHVYFYAEDVVFQEGDSNSSENLISRLSSEENQVGYYFLDSDREWAKVPFDAVKSPVDLSGIMVLILGIFCIIIFLYLISGKQHVFVALRELVFFTIFFVIIFLGLKINPLGKLVADFSVPFPIYFVFIVSFSGINFRNRNTCICYNWSYDDAIHRIKELLKSKAIEFQSEEESPGGKYSFVFNDLNRIYLTKGFGEVRIDMKEIKGLSLPKEIIDEMKKHSSPNWRFRLSSSAIRYLTIGLILLSFSWSIFI
ncbi:MAG: leucine-rich repeat domain-containing protein [Clostridiales bacterium]|nr:leucine-rich repeat domain-containing protein [Clostridiales bacterium]